MLVDKVIRRQLSIVSERGSPRTSYTAAFKLRVIAYAVSHGNRATGRQFPIHESCVPRWRLQCEHLQNTPRNKLAEHFRSAAFPEVEKEVTAWIAEKRQGGIGVSTNVICLKAKSVAQKLGIAETSFKASQRWCYGFMERAGFSIRRRTMIAQRLPQDYEEKLFKFQRYIIARRRKHDFELKYIGNADQTPLTFDIVTNSTVSEKEVKRVLILTTGHEKDRFTVMLACHGDGTKLPKYVIFKRKTLPKKARGKGGWTKDLCKTGCRPFGARSAAFLERNLCWYGIHSQLTCQHRSIAHLSP